MPRAGELAQRAEVELGADHRRELEQRAFVAGEPLDACREQRLDRRRNLYRVGVDRELPLVAAPADDLVVHEHADELAHEQRVAVGGRGQPLDEPGGQAVGAEEAGRELLGRGGVEPVEREHVFDPPVALGERRPHLAQLRTGEAQDEQRHVVHPLGEMLEEIEQQRLRPLDVVDHHDHRPRGRGRAHEATHRPERLFDRSGRGRAHQPGEDVDQPVAVGFVVGEERAEPVGAPIRRRRRRRDRSRRGSAARRARTSRRRRGRSGSRT